jgi:hypothetical protein
MTTGRINQVTILLTNSVTKLTMSHLLGINPAQHGSDSGWKLYRCHRVARSCFMEKWTHDSSLDEVRTTNQSFLSICLVWNPSAPFRLGEKSKQKHQLLSRHSHRIVCSGEGYITAITLAYASKRLWLNADLQLTGQWNNSQRPLIHRLHRCQPRSWLDSWEPQPTQSLATD